MLKPLLAALLSWCWIMFCPLAYAETRPLEAFKDGVVKIEAGNKTGSGFILDRRDRSVFVLTAFHVVEGESEPRVTFFREPHRTLPARIVRNQHELEDRGLTILKVDVDDPRGLLPLAFSQAVEPDRGKAIHAIGFYGAGRVLWSVTESTIVGETSGMLLFTGAIEEGNSGGPLIQDGEVIGVVLEKGLEHHEAVLARHAESFVEDVVGVLPVRCNVALIPAKDCQSYIRVDRRTCDYLRQGNRLYEDGAYKAAIAEYDKAIAYKDEAAVLFNNRGVIKLTMQDWDDALLDIEGALARDPDYMIAEINQLFAKAIASYFRRLEQLAKGEMPSSGLLDLLRGGQGSHGQTDGGSGWQNRLLQSMGAGVAWWTDYRTLDTWLKSYHLGNMECYGGDILVGNNEITRRQLKDLTESLQTFVDQLSQDSSL